MKRIGGLLLSAVLVLLLPVLMVAAAIAGLLSRPLERTHSEVADILARYAAGQTDRAEWDDLSCIRIPRLSRSAERWSMRNGKANSIPN
jgi:hypothetical protein